MKHLARACAVRGKVVGLGTRRQAVLHQRRARHRIGNREPLHARIVVQVAAVLALAGDLHLAFGPHQFAEIAVQPARNGQRIAQTGSQQTSFHTRERAGGHAAGFGQLIERDAQLRTTRAHGQAELHVGFCGG